MKTPYLYEYFSISEGDLIAPERSIFAGNMALNRQMGMMFLGNLFDDRVSYATGVYNGPRRSFQDFNSAKDLIGTVTARPWLNSEIVPGTQIPEPGRLVGRRLSNKQSHSADLLRDRQRPDRRHGRAPPLADFPGPEQERRRDRRARAMGRARRLVLPELLLHGRIRRRPGRLRPRQQQVLDAGQLQRLVRPGLIHA